MSLDKSFTPARMPVPHAERLHFVGNSEEAHIWFPIRWMQPSWEVLNYPHCMLMVAETHLVRIYFMHCPSRRRSYGSSFRFSPGT